MKKLLSLLTVLTLSLCIVACDKDDTPTQTPAPEMVTSDVLDSSVQISDGLTTTCSDGPQLAFDTQYGIVYSTLLVGLFGNYGESRGRIHLACFPASQPTNVKTIEIAKEANVYGPQVLYIGSGTVRVFYEKNSMSQDSSEHYTVYKEYNYLYDTLSEEREVKIKLEDGSKVPLNTINQFNYLQSKGFTGYERDYHDEANISCSTLKRGKDEKGKNCVYGVITSYLAQPILFRSYDNLATLEPFAVMPNLVQYEFDYAIMDSTIYGIYRTNRESDSISLITSPDMGKTWSTPTNVKGSIQCRPRIINYANSILYAYNIYNGETQHRPAVYGGRTNVQLRLGTDFTNNDNNKLVADVHSIYGISNIALIDIVGDVYMAYGTSVSALDYQNGTAMDQNNNGNKIVRAKDATRFVKLGDLTFTKTSLA